MRLLPLLIAIPAFAADLTVCSAGCGYTTLAAALAVAVNGDTVTMTAGQTFEGSTRLPYRPSGGIVTIRSSRWRELPPPGNRVGAAQSALMAKLQPPDTSSSVLYAMPSYKTVSSVNTATDTITTDTHGFSANEPIAFHVQNAMSTPLLNATIYYVVNPTATTFQVSATPGGAVIDLGAGYAANVYVNTVTPGNGYAFLGIEFAKKTGQDTLYSLVEIGSGNEYHRQAIPSNIIFDRVWIHGIQDEAGPLTCLMLNARNFSVTDSTISNCIVEGSESHAIAMISAPGPGLIRNNLIEAGAINILWGGGYVPLTGLISGDEGQISVLGNYIRKPMWMHYLTGTGGTIAPSGACTDGNFYINSTTGQLYKCTGVAWGTINCAQGEYYRRTDVTQNCGSGACWSCGASNLYSSYGTYHGSSYNVKNLFEIKSGTNILAKGNVFENWWNDASGFVAIMLSSKVAQYNANGWVNVQNVRFENNILRNASQGIRIGTEGGTTFGSQNFRVSARDNLMYKIGATDYPTINSNDAKPMSLAGPCNDCEIRHNTIMSGTTGGTAIYLDTAPVTRFLFADNIYNANVYGNYGDLGNSVQSYIGSSNFFNSVSVDNASSQGAPANMNPLYATNGKWITPATTLFNGGGDYRLQATSPYSASCVSGCGFKATDGKDLGADIDAVAHATDGAVMGTSWLGGTVSVSAGSNAAVISYKAPTASACTVKLFTDLARTTIHTDTTGGASDSRTGSVTDGLSRQFVLGTVSALTANTTYSATIACSGQTALVTVQTKTASGVATTITTLYPIAVTGQYSTTAAMASPTAISSSTTHAVPVPAASVRYYQRTGGPVMAFVAP